MDYTNKLYGAIEHARLRPHLVLTSKSVTALENFINGYMAIGNCGNSKKDLIYNEDDIDFNLFKFWIQNLTLDSTYLSPSFSTFLLDKCFGNEVLAFNKFFELLDGFKQQDFEILLKDSQDWPSKDNTYNPIINILSEKINDILDYIKIEPETFLTSKSITALDNFVTGYMYVSQSGFYNPSLVYKYGDVDINAFKFWLQKKPNITLSRGPFFSGLLLRDSNGDEEKAFNKFYLLLNEFRYLNRNIKSEGNVGFWWDGKV